jgi:hypothetical protein
MRFYFPSARPATGRRASGIDHFSSLATGTAFRAVSIGRASLAVFGFAVRRSRDATSTQHGPSRQAAQPSWS